MLRAVKPASALRWARQDVSSRVVPGDVEVALGVQRLTEVAVGGDRRLGVVDRSGDHPAAGIHDARAAPAEHLDAFGEGQREVRRERAAGMYCGTLTTNAPASMPMWRIDATHPSLSSAVGASRRPRPARVQGHEALGEDHEASRRRRPPRRAARSPCRWSPRRRARPVSPAPQRPAPPRTPPCADRTLSVATTSPQGTATRVSTRAARVTASPSSSRYVARTGTPATSVRNTSVRGSSGSSSGPWHGSSNMTSGK